MKKIAILLIIMTLMTACQAGPKDGPKEDLVQTTYALGTVITINLYDQGDPELMKLLVQKITEIEEKMSSQMPNSEVNAITKGAGQSPVKVSADTISVVEKALFFAALSEGAFDPTIRPVIDLWQIGSEDARVPDEAEIQEALQYVAYNQVEINKEDQTIFLAKEGMALDLGGIAKGYVADVLVEMLESEGIERAMINLGGNIYAYGEKASKEAYKIAIQTPYDTRNTYFAYIALKNKTVVTSGPYERFLEEDGQFYHHIFDATTGYPTQGNVVSVSVVSQNSMTADALSTLLFTLPPAEGLALVEGMDDVECLYVDKDFGIQLTSGLKDVFTLVDDSYYLVNP